MNNYNVVNVLRIFGAALKQPNFATAASYWNDYVTLLTANTNWDS